MFSRRNLGLRVINPLSILSFLLTTFFFDGVGDSEIWSPLDLLVLPGPKAYPTPCVIFYTRDR